MARTPAQQREYMKTYRARKKEEEPVTDRQVGLPRSNYYSDHNAPGGWTETIQEMDPRLVAKILDHPAIRTKR